MYYLIVQYDMVYIATKTGEASHFNDSYHGNVVKLLKLKEGDVYCPHVYFNREDIKDKSTNLEKLLERSMLVIL